MSFSKQLIQETINVFREEDGFVLSESEAERALTALSGLLLAFTDDTVRGALRPHCVAKDDLDLTNPNNSIKSVQRTDLIPKTQLVLVSTQLDKSPGCE